jgi:hypothetical protein
VVCALKNCQNGEKKSKPTSLMENAKKTKDFNEQRTFEFVKYQEDYFLQHDQQ